MNFTESQLIRSSIKFSGSVANFPFASIFKKRSFRCKKTFEDNWYLFSHVHNIKYLFYISQYFSTTVSEINVPIPAFPLNSTSIES